METTIKGNMRKRSEKLKHNFYKYILAILLMSNINVFANEGCLHESSFLSAFNKALSDKTNFSLKEDDVELFRGNFEYKYYLGRLITLVLSENGRENAVFLVGREKQVGFEYSFTRLVETNTFLGEILTDGKYEYESCSVNWFLKRGEVNLTVKFSADIANTYLEFIVEDSYLRYTFY